jgi:hypothetical protein
MTAAMGHIQTIQFSKIENMWLNNQAGTMAPVDEGGCV